MKIAVKALAGALGGGFRIQAGNLEFPPRGSKIIIRNHTLAGCLWRRWIYSVKALAVTFLEMLMQEQDD